MAEAAAVKKPQVPVLMPDRFTLSGQNQQRFVVDLPMTVTQEQMLDPSFWAHVAEQMHPLDEVVVRAEDGSWIAYLVVGWCERNFAHVVLDRKVTIRVEREPPTSSVKHRVDWKGPHQKFCVIRTADAKLLHEGEQSKDAALKWLREYEAGAGR